MQRKTGQMASALLSLALLALLAGGPAAAASWSVLGPAPAHRVASQSVQGFAESVALSTAGGVTLELAPGADAATVLAHVAAARAAMGVFPLALLEAGNPVLAMDRVPFLVTNFVQARKLWQVLRPEVERVLQARGLVLLYAVPSPPPAPIARRPLLTLAAWRGLRLRVAEPALQPLSRALGAQPVSAVDLADALAGGKAEVAFASAAYAADVRAWDYASDFLDASAWYPKQLVAVNRGVLSALDKGQREALLAAARAAGDQAWVLSEQATRDGVQKLRDYGVKTAEPSVALLIQLEALGRDLLFRWSDAAGETGARLVEAYYAIR